MEKKKKGHGGEVTGRRCVPVVVEGQVLDGQHESCTLAPKYLIHVKKQCDGVVDQTFNSKDVAGSLVFDILTWSLVSCGCLLG